MYPSISFGWDKKPEFGVSLASGSSFVIIFLWFLLEVEELISNGKFLS